MSQNLGATARFRPWTPAEDEALGTRYLTAGAAALAGELARTESAVFHRARRLGLLKNRRWTAAEDERLRMLWGVMSVRRVARELGRTEITTYWRAQHLGLGLGCPQGFEYLSHAAERTGFDIRQLRRILAWGRVEVRSAMSRRHAHRRSHHVVDPYDVDEAVRAWLDAETVFAAAKARRVGWDALLGWLAAAARMGVPIPPKPRRREHWRVPSKLLDQVVADARNEQRRRAQLESLSAASRRAGVSRWSLAKWLRGTPLELHGRLKLVRPEVVDRIVASNRKRARGRAA